MILSGWVSSQDLRRAVFILGGCLVSGVELGEEVGRMSFVEWGWGKTKEKGEKGATGILGERSRQSQVEGIDIVIGEK